METPPHPYNPTAYELGWLAALFEGEGHIGWSGKNGVQLSIEMADADTIQRWQYLVGCGNTYIRKKDKEHHREKTVWYVGDRHNVRRILLLILPGLGERRTARAMEALERLRKNPGVGRSPNSRPKPTTHCKNGHERTEENTTTLSNGTKRCKQCHRDSWHRYYAKKKATKALPFCQSGEPEYPKTTAL